MNSILRRRRAMMAAQESGDQIINGANLTWEQGNIDASGVPAESDYSIRTANYIPVKAGKYIQYTGEIKDANNVRIFCYVIMYDSNNDFVGKTQILASASTVTPSISIPANCEKVKFYIGHSNVAMIPAYGEIFTASVGENETHLVSSLYNHAVAAGDYIWTGISPLKSDFNLTMLLDYNITTNPTSGTGRLWKIIFSYHNSLGRGGLTIGKKSSTSSIQSVWWMNATEQNASGTKTTAGRHRIALVHSAGSNTLTMYYRYGTENKLTFTYSDTFSADACTLYLGATAGTDYMLPAGTVTKMEIYDTILDSATINAFFS